MTDHAPIDEQFREHRKDWEGTPPPRLWDQLEDRLDTYTTPGVRRKKNLFRLGIAATVLAVVGLSFAFFVNRSPQTGHLAVLSETEPPAIETTLLPLADGMRRDRNPEMAPPLPTTPALARTPALDGTVTRSATGAPASAGTTTISPVERKAAAEPPEVAEALAPETLSGMSSIDVQANSREEAADEEELAAVPTAKKRPGPEEAEDVLEIQTAKAEKVARERDVSRKSTSKASFATGGDYNEQEAVSAYRASGDRTETFASPSLTILIPRNQKGQCPYTAILVEPEQFYTDPCQSDALDIAKNISGLLGNDHLLYELLYEREEYVRQVAAQVLPTCPEADQVTFVYRLTTSLSSIEDRVAWPMNRACLPDEAMQILEELLLITKGTD